MNANELAVEISKKEGLKIQLPIGQVKEVMKVMRQLCYLDEEARSAIVKYLRLK